MSIDLATLLAAITIAAASMALPILFVALRAGGHQGLTLWGAGLVLNTLSYPVFGLRAFGWYGSSIALTNLLTGLTLVAHTLAITAFQYGRARPLPRWLVWLPLLVNMLVVLVFLHDDPWRNVLVAATQGVMAAVLLREAWAPGLTERRLTGRLVLIGGASMLLATLVWRTALMVLAHDWDARYKVPGEVQGITYLVVLAVLLINSVGFVLMQMELAIERQRQLATHDALTGLYNRSALRELLALCAAQSRRRGEPMAFLMLDIDHFKRVNDQHGHLAGDAVLREVARLARQRLRQADILARYGGEEFLAILPATDGAGALRLAETVREAIAAAAIGLPGRAETIPITISIGVHAGIPDASSSAVEAMIERSDRALYAAKAAGRNRVERL